MAILSGTSKKELRSAAHDLQAAAGDATRTVREAAEEAGSTVREFVADKSERAAELRHTAMKKISSNPMKSVAFATLGGLIIGAFLRR